ncbi:MAG: FlgD immunoglobulin-like domain containing protein [Spirochaetales bacterium]
MNKLVSLFVFFVLTSVVAFANGQKELPPTVNFPEAVATYVAPANPNASIKALTLTFAPAATTGHVLKAWTFDVYDATGRLVWQKADQQTLDRGFFGELFNFGERPAVTVPAQLTWDGLDAEGKPAPNGTYTWFVTVTDSQGQTTRSAPRTVVIQNTAIAITRLGVDYSIFSPRGKRSTLTVHQSGSREKQWTGQFLNAAGETVRTIDWTNSSGSESEDQAPVDFEWDGKDQAGQFVYEGEYTYTLTGFSRTGAKLSQALPVPVIISEKPGVLRLSSDQAVFSPKADKGSPSTLTLKPDSGNADALVDWTVTVADPAAPAVVLWTKAGKAPLPVSLAFDGKDLRGKDLGEGRYQAVLKANFSNGNSGESPALPFDIDTTPPQGRYQSAVTVYGGSGRLTLPVEFNGDGNVNWTFEVLGADGLPVGNSVSGTGSGVKLEVQSADAGKARPDGAYTLRASAHDKSGNLGTATYEITKDSRSRKVTLEPSSSILVPGNNANGSISVTPVFELADGLTGAEWAVSTTDAKATLVDQKRLSADDTGLAPYTWTGRDIVGKTLADGSYRVSLTATYANGAVSSATKDVAINSKYFNEPQGTLSLSDTLFGGTGRPHVSVNFKGDAGLEWTLVVTDKAGATVGKYPLGKGAPAPLDVPAATDANWPDGSYTLTASAVSAQGVKGSTSQSLRKDSRPMKVALDLSRAVVVPGKGANGQLRVTPILDILDSVVNTTLELRNEAGDLVASQTRDGLLTFWDWSADASPSAAAAADGAYTAKLAVTYANGTVAKADADLKVDSGYLTEPQGKLSVSAAVFGSASRPTATATFAGDAGVVWTLDVLAGPAPGTKSVRQYPLGDSGQGKAELGTDAAGKALPDGVYTLKATATSKGGLVGTATAQVRKDSRALKVDLDLSSPVLVPGNSLNGSVKITPVLDVLDSIETTTLSFLSPDGKLFDERGGAGLVPFWDWSGKDPQGQVLPDGDYQLSLKVAYANGTVSQARKSVKLDSSFLKEPQGQLTSSDAVFGGSGRTGVTISFAGDAGLPWTLEILDSDGKTVLKSPLGDKGQASVPFSGLDGQGKALADGPYTVRASAVSKAGVSGVVLLQLRKDSRQAKVSLDLSRTVIVPGKGANGSVRITPLLEAIDSVEKTVVSVLGPDGKTVGEKSAAGPLSFWDWNGLNAQTKALANGTYEVALTVNYANGSVSRASGQVKIDSTYLNDQGPLVEMTLSTKTFAPNNVDGATDLTIKIKTTEGVVPVDNWQLAVIDPRGKTFRQWSGKGLPPASLYWDGKSDTGDTVESGDDYQLQLKVADTQKNVTRQQATVTIDIAVVKIAEGKYKIVVSSIQFPGNSSDLFKLPGDQLNKNLYVLKRLANALGKFPGYKIRLEGYAVSEFWNDAKAAAKEQTTQLLPLSLDRANSVRAVMVLLGIDPERFTVLGFGGDKPIVPHGDLENRWKNRRVEFYLDKN